MRFLLVLVPALALAAPKKPNVDAVSEGVVALINKQQRVVMVDVIGKERTWTDSAIAERGTAFPKPIATLMDKPSPDRKLEAGKVAKLVESYQLHRDGYEDAKVQRTGPDCFITAGQVSALVNCVYVDYLEARYPAAKFLVKGAFEPALFVEKDRVHALLMPMKR